MAGRLRVSDAIIEKYGAMNLVMAGMAVGDKDNDDMEDDKFYWTQLGLDVMDDFWKEFRDWTVGHSSDVY